MTGLASRLLVVVTLAAWGGPVFAQTAQTAPEDLAAIQAEAESGDAKAQSRLGAARVDVGRRDRRAEGDHRGAGGVADPGTARI